MKFSLLRRLAPDQRALAMLTVFFAFTLRVFHLGAQAIWWDESLSLYRATRDLPTILANTILVQRIVTTDLQPPLYFLILHFVVGALGTSEFALRFLSLAANVATVALLYVVGRRMVSPAVGWLAASLGALSPFYVWFAQEARPYALVLFWSLLGIYALLRLFCGDVVARKHSERSALESLGRDAPLIKGAWGDSSFSPSAAGIASRPTGAHNHSRSRWMLLYLLSTLAALYTFYYALFLLPFQALFILLLTWRHPPSWKYALLPVLPALAAIPLLPVIARGAAGNANSGPSFVPFAVILRDLLNSFSVGVTLDASQAGWIDASMLLLLLLGMILARYVSSDRAVSFNPGIGDYASRFSILAYLLVPTLFLFAASYVRPLYQNSRYLIFVSPAFYLGLALGMAALGRQRRFVALPALAIFVIGALVSLNNLYFNPLYGKDDHRAWAESLRERVHPGDFLILDSPHTEALFDYYAGNVVPYTTLPILSSFGSPASSADLDRAAVLDALARNPRVWFLSMHVPFDDPDARIEKLLNQDGVLIDWANFRATSTEIALSLYAAALPSASPSEISHRSNLFFDSRLRLLGFDAPQAFKSGARGVVKLFWQLDEPAGEDYGVSLRALDASGRRVAQWDAVPLGNRAGSSTWVPGAIVVDAHDLPIDPGTPAGRYQLQIQVYHPATSNGIGDAVIIGEINIAQ